MTLRIGAGQGFYGDTPRGALDVAENGDVSYICFDALAELTMAILQKDRLRDAQGGYARDLGSFMRTLLPICHERGIKLITNAGGMNPHAAAQAVASVARDLGLNGLRIGVVTGDSLTERLGDIRAAGTPLRNTDTGAEFSDIAESVIFAVAYLGADPIREALARGADVVITGRVADASLFVAPMLHEFGWDLNDHDKLAAGVVVGHLLECSAQSTGGNFGGDWRAIPAMERIGYPIAAVEPDGSAVICKTPGSGGRITFATVAEQLLYEVGDPRQYLNPDVSVDFTSVHLDDLGDDRVRVSGTRGAAPPETLKVVAGHLAGWAGVASLTYAWPDAVAKAERAAAVVDAMVADAGIIVRERVVELIGLNSLHGGAAPIPEPDTVNEVTLRWSGRFDDERSAGSIARLATPLALNGPPFIGGGAPPAPPRALVGTWPTRIARDHVTADVDVIAVATR